MESDTRRRKRGKCGSCRYRSGPGAIYDCDYAYLAGATRLAAPAKGCRYYKRGKRLSKPEQTNICINPDRPGVAGKPNARKHREWGSKFDWDRAMELYRAGSSDREIQKALGCKSKSSVVDWRARNNLEPNVVGHKTHPKNDWNRAMELYRKGATDIRIRDALGCNSADVYQWRRRNELPPNQKEE